VRCAAAQKTQHEGRGASLGDLLALAEHSPSTAVPADGTARLLTLLNSCRSLVGHGCPPPPPPLLLSAGIV
jgi:hypothetical protein